MLHHLHRFTPRPRHRRGATIISYALLVGLISVGALFVIVGTGESVSTMMGKTADVMGSVVTDPSPKPGPCPASATPGDTCPDGTIFVGFSLAGGPGAGERIYAMPTDQSSSIIQQDAGGDPPGDNCNNGGASCFTGEANTFELATKPYWDNNPSQPANHPAALLCWCLGEGVESDESGDGIPTECPASNPTGNGHDDWYIPALAELDLMYSNLVSPDDSDNPVALQGERLDSSASQTNGQGGTDGGSRSGPHAAGFASANYWSSTDTNGNLPTMMWWTDFTDGDQNVTTGQQSARLRCIRREN